MIQDAKLTPIERDAVRDALFFFRVLKNFVERATKGARELERQLERRRILSAFERDDGLACDSAQRRKFNLRHLAARQTPLTNLIDDRELTHRRSHA